MSAFGEHESWACIAYGRELPEILGTSQVCFFPDSACQSDGECVSRMGDERKRVYRRMQELSAVDPFWAGIAEGFATPESLLGGDDGPHDPTGP